MLFSSLNVLCNLYMCDCIAINLMVCKIFKSLCIAGVCNCPYCIAKSHNCMYTINDIICSDSGLLIAELFLSTQCCIYIFKKFYQQYIRSKIISPWKCSRCVCDCLFYMETNGSKSQCL